jgi:hypothetical protein
MKTNITKISRIMHLASAGKRIVFTLALAMVAITAFADETPDAFTWQGVSDNDWFTPGVWLPSATSRTVPRIKGDSAQIGYDNYVTISSNITLSTLSVGATSWDWHWGGFGALASTEPTLTFDAAGTDPEALFLMAEGKTDFWSPLKINLNSPLKLKKGEYWNGKSIVRLAAAIEGGSPETPTGLIVEGDIAVTLENNANSFYGDLQIGSTNSSDTETVLALGWERNQSLGNSAQLGNPTNRVILVNGDWKSQLHVANAGGGSLSDRTVLGSGRIVGSYYNDWRFVNQNNLNIGSGTVIEPSNVVTESPYGTISVYANNASIDAGSRLVLSVGTGVNDVVNYQVNSKITLNSAIEIEEVDNNIPIATEWNIITVKGNNDGFTFSPSSTSSNYAFTVSGNTSEGWIVSAYKIRNTDGTSDQPLALNGGVSLIGETNAVVSVNAATIDPDGSATLRVYYGTTDGGEVPSAWDAVMSYPVITQTGGYSIQIDDLTLGETYSYRHSISNSFGEVFSLGGVNTFTTVPYSTPDTFTWTVVNDQWFGEDVWTPASSNARQRPGFAGDNIIFWMGGGRWWDDWGVNHQVNLDQDATVTTLTLNQGPGATLLFSATNNPTVLTLDAGEGVTSHINCGNYLRNLQFGTGSDALSVELADPIQIRYTAADTHNVYIYSELSGGTDELPSDIYLDTMTGDGNVRLNFLLFNTNNTFRGNIYVGPASTDYWAWTTLCLGAGPWGADYPSDDAMCGDPANLIILQGNRAAVRLTAPAGAPANFGRTLIGGGTLSVSNQRDEWNWDLRSLHLSSSAHLEPSGTLTVNAVELTADPEAQYVFEVSATNGVSGNVAFSVTEPLTLDGSVILTQFDENERIPAGTSWDIMTVAASATTFAPSLVCSSGYTIETSGDDTAGWTVSVVKALSGTLLIIK